MNRVLKSKQVPYYWVAFACLVCLQSSCDRKKVAETGSDTAAVRDSVAVANRVEVAADSSGYRPAGNGAATAEWTILVYLNGDNNLESAALEDFAEMANVPDDPRINVVVQFDRSPHYSTRAGNWSNTLRFKIGNGITPYPANALQDEESRALGEVNMGNAQELVKFVSWAKKNYPAKHYVLDIWGHGQGWRTQKLQAGQIVAAVDSKPSSRTEQGRRAINVLDTLAIRPADGNAAVKSVLDKVPNSTAGGTTLASLTTEIHQKSANESVYVASLNDETSLARSVSPDDTSGGTLYNASIQNALAGQQLDVIGFDACLMAMVETSYAMQQVAKVMVASEALEPNEGWNYTTYLTNLQQALQNAPNHSIDAKAMGSLMVTSYEVVSGPANTLSAVDLAMVNPLARRISALSQALIANLSTEALTVQAARNECVHYADDNFTFVPSLNDEIPSFPHIDLAAFCKKLIAHSRNQQVKTRATEVLAALDQAIIKNFAGTRALQEQGSHGLAIYFPLLKSYYDVDPYADGAYRRGKIPYPVQFVEDHQWVDFLQGYYAHPGISPQRTEPLHVSTAWRFGEGGRNGSRP